MAGCLLGAAVLSAPLAAQEIAAGARVPIRFADPVSGFVKAGTRVHAQTIGALRNGSCVAVPPYARLAGIVVRDHARRFIRFDSIAAHGGALPIDGILDSLEFERPGLAGQAVLAGETGTLRLERAFHARGCGVPYEWQSVAPPAAPLPAHTATRGGRPGDPVNLVFEGSRAELAAAFRAAGWTPVAPKTARRVAIAVLAALDNLPDRGDPVSNQFVAGRRQDLAFERAGPTIRIRHHLRLWQVDSALWAGAASEDVGLLLWRIAEPTHRIDPAVDLERDETGRELEAGWCASVRGGPPCGARRPREER